MAKITQIPGNTPINAIPLDYFPRDRGFWLEIEKGRDKGKKLFFRDSLHNEGKPEQTILFVHGNPECSYSYRNVIKHLTIMAKKPFRIINLDHIGFGLSDQATYQMVCSDHAKNLLELIYALELHNINLIIHDWGGPIGIGALIREPERLKNLIILNSTVFPIPKADLTYNNYPISWLGWSKTPYIIPDRFWGAFASYAIFIKQSGPMSLLFNMLRYIAMAELGFFPNNEIVARKIYCNQFDSTRNVKSSKRLVLQSAKWAQGNSFKDPQLGTRNTTSFYRFIQANIAKFWGMEGQKIGVKVILGGWDPLAKSDVINQWLTALPQLRGNILRFKKFGHFIEEYLPVTIAKSIIQLTGL